MKNKNNPKSKKLARQSRALAYWQLWLMSLGEFSNASKKEDYTRYAKGQIAILKAKGVK